ncbi:LppU/SCO3897 family protein [Nocardia niigatensis]
MPEPSDPTADPASAQPGSPAVEPAPVVEPEPVVEPVLAAKIGSGAEAVSPCAAPGNPEPDAPSADASTPDGRPWWPMPAMPGAPQLAGPGETPGMNPGWGQPVPPGIRPPGATGYPPPDGGVVPPHVADGIAPEAPRLRKRRWAVWFAVLAVVIIGAAAALFGWVATRPDPVAYPVGACVSLEDSAKPVVYGCGDSKSAYRIVGRADLVFPVDSACARYSDVTQAVTDVAGTGAKASTILCLAPTRFNLTDPGSLQVDDCVDVKGAGDTMTRVDCGMTPAPAKVVAVELHSKIPVIDQACKQYPAARLAFAHLSLGGRAIVVCAVETDAKAIGSVQVGDCTDRDLMGRMACTATGAAERVLSVRTVHQKPTHPECASDRGANSVMVQSNDKTDLFFVVCLGPADQSDARYAVVGDCIYDNNARTGSAADTTRIDCGDPRAAYQVTDRHESNDNHCPSGTAISLTYNPGTTTGLTICMRRR